MRYAAFKGPRSQHVEKLWMIGSYLEVPWGPRSFCSGGTDEYRVCLNQKDSPNGVPMSCMAVAGLWLLTIQRQTASIPTSQPRCYVLHIFFSCWDWCTSWLEGGMGKLSICFFYFGKKKSEDFRRFSGWGFGFHWFTTSRQVDGATPVIFPSSLLTSAPWCRGFLLLRHGCWPLRSLRSQPGSGWGDPGKVCSSRFLAKQKRKRSLRKCAKDVCMDVSYYQF